MKCMFLQQDLCCQNTSKISFGSLQSLIHAQSGGSAIFLAGSICLFILCVSVILFGEVQRMVWVWPELWL